MSLSSNSSIVNRTIDLNYANQQRASSLKWIVVNVMLLLVFSYDLWHKCAGYTSGLHWAEGCAAGVLGANVLQHALRLARARRVRGSAAACSPRARPAAAPHPPRARSADAELSPARRWRVADATPPPSPPSPGTPSPPRLERPPAADEFIADRRHLANYLREYAERAEAQGAEAWAPLGGGAAPAQYQLSAPAGERGVDEAAAGAAAHSPRAWRRLLLDAQRAAAWNQNLRLWLHVTVLARLVREMQRADAALVALGLADARLGHASLERLQKLPAAAALLPYLEPFADQRYAVQRIRELAQGGCLSSYRWNGGGSDWDESKPTDAEIVLHLLAAYLDGQLPPSPAARPFSSVHVTAAPAPPPRGPHTLAIHRTSLRPPHYVLALHDETVEVARGRNNLLHTVLLFIAAAARADPPALQRLHLGPAGLNMLWIIGR